MSDDVTAWGLGEMIEWHDGDVSVDGETAARLDALLSHLGDSRRRYLLYVLASSSQAAVERPELVSAIRALEQSAGSSDDGPTRERIGADLHHKHLPRLADAGIIRYDRRQGTVRYDGTELLDELLEYVRTKEM